jgi:ABC-2 type transport system permease protein
MIRILRHCMGYSLAIEAASPLGSWSNAIGAAVDLAVSLAFFQFVFLKGVDSIRGWSWGHLLVLVGSYNIVLQLHSALFGASLGRIPRLIRTGSLDTVLLKPVDSQILVSFHLITPARLVYCLYSVPAVVMGIRHLGLSVEPVRALLYLVTLLCGTVVLYASTLCAQATAFWLGDVYGVSMLAGQGMELARYPLDIFPRAMQLGLLTVFPAAFVAYIPARVLIGDYELVLVGAGLVMAGSWLIISRLAWRAGLRRYVGAGE